MTSCKVILFAFLLLLAPVVAETADGCWEDAGASGAVAHWTFNNTASPPFTEVCYGNDAYNYSGSIDSVAGKFDNAGEFLSAETEYATAPVNIKWNFTWNENTTMCAWAYPLSLGAQGWIVSPVQTKYWMMIQIVANNSYRCLKYDGANPVASVYSNAAAANTWTHICCGTETASDKVFMFINGSFHANVTDTSNAATQSSVNHSFGRWGGGGNYFNGRIDEIYYYNGSGFGVDGYNWVTLTSAISNITTYNNVTGIAGAPPPGVVGCSVTANDFNLTNGSVGGSAWSNDDSMRAEYTPVCYGASNYRCDISRNGTLVGGNASVVVNASSNYIITNVTWGEYPPAYSASVVCSNGTFSNSSVSTTIMVDSVAPVLNITYPANTTYDEGTSTVLNFSFSEANPNYCVWRLDGGANSTIVYVNGTAITPIVGSYHVELWCFDNALNSVYDEVYFRIIGLANISLYEPAVWLLTFGMPREFRVNYTAFGSCSESYYPEHSGVISTPVIGTDISYCDVINATHHLCISTSAGGTLYVRSIWTSNGTVASTKTRTGDTRGVTCLPDGSGRCYYAYKAISSEPPFPFWDLRLYFPANQTDYRVNFVNLNIYAERNGIAYDNGDFWTRKSTGNLSLMDTNLNFIVTTNTQLNASNLFDTDDESLYIQKFNASGSYITKRGLGVAGYYVVCDTYVLNSSTYGPIFNYGFFYDHNTNRVYFALKSDGGGNHPYWLVAPSDIGIPNASCNLTYGGSTFQMTDTGFYHSITVIENYSDHSSNTVIASCSSPDYESKSDSIIAETDNWITPRNIQTGTLYTTMSDYADSDGLTLTDHTTIFSSGDRLCNKIRLKGNSINTTHEINFFVYEGLYIGEFEEGYNTTLILNMTLHNEIALKPDLSSSLASCSITAYASASSPLSSEWLNCSTNPTQNLVLNKDYYICSDTPRISPNKITVSPTGNVYMKLSGLWYLIEREYALTLVTENTDEQEVGNLTGYYVDGFITDCGNQSGLAGVSVNIYQYNSTGNWTYSATTDSTGYFAVTNIKPGIQAHTLITREPDYESVEEDFLLTSEFPRHDLSNCMYYRLIKQVSIETKWGLENNVTNELETVSSWTDWKPNITYKKDSLLSTIGIVVKDSLSNEGVEDISFSVSDITTTCSFSITPTTYYFVDKGSGAYQLTALIAGTNQTNLYAWCADQDYFQIYYKSAGINAKTRISFEGFKMRATNVNVLTDSLTGYSWARASGDFFYDAQEEKNKPLDNNLSCNIRLEQTNGTNITSWLSATTTDNTVRANFSSLGATPDNLLVHFNCNATGFDTYDASFPVHIGTDVFEVARCYLLDSNGDEVEWHKKGELIQHQCVFRAYSNASLLSLMVRSRNEALNIDKALRYARDSNNQWYFQSDLTADAMPKGLHEWNMDMSNTPTGLKEYTITYYQFVKVYWIPPKKISPDYCDGENCPKKVYRGQDYFCSVVTEFETEYTSIIMGIKLGGTGDLVSIPHTDDFNAETNRHTTTIRIPAIGETGRYGILSDTSIQCYAEFYIDEEHLVYGQNPTNMLTNYYHEYKSDALGLQAVWSEFLASDEPMTYATGKIISVPGEIFERMAIVDEQGNINPIILILYLIGFALIVGLMIVFINTRVWERGGK